MWGNVQDQVMFERIGERIALPLRGTVSNGTRIALRGAIRRHWRKLACSRTIVERIELIRVDGEWAVDSATQRRAVRYRLRLLWITEWVLRSLILVLVEANA